MEAFPMLPLKLKDTNVDEVNRNQGRVSHATSAKKPGHDLGRLLNRKYSGRVQIKRTGRHRYTQGFIGSADLLSSFLNRSNQCEHMWNDSKYTSVSALVPETALRRLWQPPEWWKCLTSSSWIPWNFLGDRNAFCSKLTLCGLLDGGWTPERPGRDIKATEELSSEWFCRWRQCEWHACNEAIRVSPSQPKIAWCSIEEGSDSYMLEGAQASEVYDNYCCGNHIHAFRIMMSENS